MEKLRTLSIDVETGTVILNGEVLPSDTSLKLEKIKGNIYLKVEKEYEAQIIPF